MNRRLRPLALGAILSIVFCEVADGAPSAPRATPLPRVNVAERVIPDASTLYSSHARRLIASYLRLRMLELRETDLDRVRAVIEGKLRVDDLIAPPTQPRPRMTSR